MIHVHYEEMTDKASMKVEGSLGQIYAELAIVIKAISNQKELELSVDDVFDMIKDSIEYEVNNTELGDKRDYLHSDTSLTKTMIEQNDGVPEGFKDYGGNENDRKRS